MTKIPRETTFKNTKRNVKYSSICGMNSTGHNIDFFLLFTVSLNINKYNGSPWNHVTELTFNTQH